MDRLSVLEAEINKKIAVDEKSGGVIQGWSPNNVRRLFIGADKAIIQYFMTGGKYGRLYEIISLNHDFGSLTNQLMQEPAKFRSILNVLVKGRVCSSVEEIFFCSEGYPAEVLRQDMSLVQLASSQEKAESRFVRLRHVSRVDMTLEQLWAVNQADEEAKRGTSLFLDAVRAQGIQVHSVYEAHKDSWWNHTSLRPRFYPFEVKLGEYFEKVKEKKEYLVSLDKERATQRARFVKTYNTVFPQLTPFVDAVEHVTETSATIYEGLSFLDRVEWGSSFDRWKFFLAVRKFVQTGHPDLFRRIRGVDFSILRSLGNDTDRVGETVNSFDTLSKVADFVWRVLGESEVSSYVQASKKLDEREGLNTIKEFYFKVYRYMVNLLYLTLAKRMSRNSVAYAQYELDKVPNKQDIQTLKVTRGIVEFCNLHTEPGVSSECFKVAGMQLVKEEEFEIKDADRAIQVLLASMIKQEG